MDNFSTEFEKYVSSVKPCSEDTYKRMHIACLKMIANALDAINDKLMFIDETLDEVPDEINRFRKEINK